MRLLFLGDVVGRAGRDAVAASLPALRRALRLDLVVVNAENASHGFGLLPDHAKALFAAGADVLTLGNHAYDRKEILPFLETERRVIRPLNFPAGSPGAGSAIATLQDGRRALVINAQLRLFMEPLDCPFRATAQELARHRLGASVQAILVDIHGEATSEKQAFAYSFDGLVSVVVGTHTHVPTADQRILPSGTAFQTDAGMCGDYESVIGMAREAALSRFWRRSAERMAPAEGVATLCGLLVETDDATGRAVAVHPVRTGGVLHATSELSATPG